MLKGLKVLILSGNHTHLKFKPGTVKKNALSFIQHRVKYHKILIRKSNVKMILQKRFLNQPESFFFTELKKG